MSAIAWLAPVDRSWPQTSRISHSNQRSRRGAGAFIGCVFVKRGRHVPGSLVPARTLALTSQDLTSQRLAACGCRKLQALAVHLDLSNMCRFRIQRWCYSYPRLVTSRP